MRDINQITGDVVDAAHRLHTRLGPGLMEHVYDSARAILDKDRAA